jgi:hypothetical protein
MKKTFNNKCKISAFILCVALFTPQPGFAQKATRLSKTPAPLTAEEVVAIYRNKTWNWPTGGGRFIGEGRRFIAVTGENGKQSLGEGTWTVDDKGRMCMRATWKTGAVSAKANTCFAHGRIGNVLYQKRQPNGDWYVFRHSPPRATDEFSKLVNADGVTMKALALKQTLMTKK